MILCAPVTLADRWYSRSDLGHLSADISGAELIRTKGSEGLVHKSNFSMGVAVDTGAVDEDV